jgi:hypothetical protein
MLTPSPRPSGSRLLGELRCGGCGGEQFYRSRPRGFFEKYALPALFLQPVRCGRCYHRRYILRATPVLEPVHPGRKQSQSEQPSDSNSRVA